MDWESTFAAWGTTAVNAATENYANKNAQSLKLSNEGQRVQMPTGMIGGFPTSTVLLIGGGIVLFMMLRD
jgi:hypothetical protein